MKNTKKTILALALTFSLAGVVGAADRPKPPERPTDTPTTDRPTDRPTVTVTVKRPERPSDADRPTVARPELPDGLKAAIAKFEAAKDAFRDGVNEIRTNEDLTNEQKREALKDLAEVRVRLAKQALRIKKTVRSIKESVRDVKKRLTSRDKVVEAAAEAANSGGTAAAGRRGGQD
ncbi:MAG: hypothetical protein ACKVHO_11745 [Verrucomicrobiia bacterium]|jgi:hypothetical protein